MNTSTRTGRIVQSVSRTLILLKILGRQRGDELDLHTLVQETGLNRSTAFRLLACLAQAGYVRRNEITGSYRLDINAMQLGLTAMTRPPIVERCRPIMQLIARATEDTVFLVVRNGDFAHCLHLEQGEFPVQVISTLSGSFRLLGLGTAGQALLATLDDRALESLFRQHAREYERNGLTVSRLRGMVRRTRKEGYSASVNLLIQGAGAVGLPFEVTPGHYAALSVGAISSRMGDDRQPVIAKMMKDALRQEGLKPFF